MNELIFIAYVLTVSTAALVALRIGKSALIGLICVQCILVNLFVTKEIVLFGFTATASDALAVGITLSLNLLQEFFGKYTARKTIWISFAGSIFYTVLTMLHLAYKPGITDVSQSAFETLLRPMPRIVVASLFVYIIVQYLDSYLFGYLSQRFKHKHFILRNYASTAISQLVDTVLFSFLGLYCLNQNFCKLSTIVQIIVVSYIIKLLVILIAGPYLALSKLFIKAKNS